MILRSRRGVKKCRSRALMDAGRGGQENGPARGRVPRAGPARRQDIGLVQFFQVTQLVIHEGSKLGDVLAETAFACGWATAACVAVATGWAETAGGVAEV